MFENAKWIAKRDDSNIKWVSKSNDIREKPAPLFRKAFKIEKDVKRVLMSACGLGLGYYYINGVSVTEDVLITPVTAYDKTLIYVTYEVTDLIKQGMNAMGCVLGEGCYSVTYDRWDYYKAPWLHHPKLIMEISIEYSDGSCDSVVTDTSWKTNYGPIVYNETRRGEIYDARKEIPGWNEAEFNDDNWGNAFICRSPGGVLYPMDFPPIRITKTIVPVKISNYVYDLGQNISGWVRIEVSGHEGDAIVFRYAETLDNDGNIDPKRLNKIVGAATHTDTYILKGEGTEKWAPKFAYHGFRYVEVKGAPQDFKITAEVVHTDLDIIGEFECSDEMLNKIHSAARWSTLTNLHGIPTDCPQREQNGWTGDAQLSAEQTIINYDAAAFYKKWLRDFKDAQRPSGQLPGIIPTSGWGYNWGSGPAWDSALFLIPYYIYKYTGDSSVIAYMYENMERYIEFIVSMADDYIVDFGLGDWCPPAGSEICPTAITDTAYFYADAVMMGEFSEVLGKDGEEYLLLAEKIKEAFRRKFMENGRMKSNTQTAYACAVYQGLYNEDEIPGAIKQLIKLIEENDNHIDCGVLGTKYMFRVLSENGYADLMYKMVVNPTGPSYASWINRGMTTLCENWDLSGSWNHHMFSEVDTWFYKHLAGIRPAKPGFEKLIISPCFVEGIEWVRAKHRNIEVFWNKEEIQIKTPVEAELHISGRVYKLKKGCHTIERDEKKD